MPIQRPTCPTCGYQSAPEDGRVEPRCMHPELAINGTPSLCQINRKNWRSCSALGKNWRPRPLPAVDKLMAPPLEDEK